MQYILKLFHFVKNIYDSKHLLIYIYLFRNRVFALIYSLDDSDGFFGVASSDDESDTEADLSIAVEMSPLLPAESELGASTSRTQVF